MWKIYGTNVLNCKHFTWSYRNFKHLADTLSMRFVYFLVYNLYILYIVCTISYILWVKFDVKSNEHSNLIGT
jgi:hypothetical protein